MKVVSLQGAHHITSWCASLKIVLQDRQRIIQQLLIPSYVSYDCRECRRPLYWASTTRPICDQEPLFNEQYLKNILNESSAKLHHPFGRWRIDYKEPLAMIEYCQRKDHRKSWEESILLRRSLEITVSINRIQSRNYQWRMESLSIPSFHLKTNMSSQLMQ